MLFANQTIKKRVKKVLRLPLRAPAFFDNHSIYDRLLGKKEPIIFCFHGIGKPPHFVKLLGEVPSIESFKKFVNAASKHVEFIPLEVLLERNRYGDKISKCAAMTFDDGWKSTFDNALPILAECKIPATVFINPGFVDNNDCPDFLAFCWLESEGYGPLFREKLAKHGSPDNSWIEDASFDSVLRWMISMPAESKIISKSLKSTFNEVNIDPVEIWKKYQLFCESGQLEEIERTLFSLGNHGFMHINYNTSNASSQNEDLKKARIWFEKENIPSIPVFALPFGGLKHLGRKTTSIANVAGYVAVLLAEGNNLSRYYEKDVLLRDRLPFSTKWDERDIKLICNGVKVIHD